ncbi:MAG TPA: hypothetical protein VLR46_01705 [Candidatus Dormibacteraeota bacterium]|nr:hypothetical protein [Candidatus Dormibacteraeota bacterium]
MRSPSRSRRPNDSSLAIAVVRLAAGAVSLGSDELSRRLRTLPREVESASSRPEVAARDSGRFSLAGFGVGIAMETAQLASRLVSTAADGSRRVVGQIGRARSLPVLKGAAGPAKRRYERYEAALRRLSERGRREQLIGRHMVEHLIRDTTSRSVKDIAEFAVNEVTHSPEVAALVRTQSTGLATDTILEVRANSEQADDRLERRVHSWLHLRRPNSPGAGGADGRPGA